MELERSRLCRPTHLARVKAAAEIGRRIVKGGSDAPPRYLRSTDDTIAYFKPKLEALETEVLFLVLVDTRKKVMRVIELAKGGVNQLSVYPREILAPAIRELAHSMILVHSHPSGDSTPSQADRELTRRVQAAPRWSGSPCSTT